tara:strand:+ start:6278 stop:6424 length:147 start_codon:yes stop_codon:yes gene_type:complete
MKKKQEKKSENITQAIICLELKEDKIQNIRKALNYLHWELDKLTEKNK